MLFRSISVGLAGHHAAPKVRFADFADIRDEPCRRRTGGWRPDRSAMRLMLAKTHCLTELCACGLQNARLRAGPAMARRPAALIPCLGTGRNQWSALGSYQTFAAPTSHVSIGDVCKRPPSRSGNQKPVACMHPPLKSEAKSG